MKIIRTMADLLQANDRRRQENQETARTAYEEETASLDHFGKEGRAFLENPVAYNAYNPAVASGATEYHSQVTALRDHTHPDHESANTLFLANEHEHSKVALMFVSRAINRAGAKPLQGRNQAYELALLNAIIPGKDGSADEAATITKLKAAYRSKWSASGYAGDLKFFDDFCNKNKFDSGTLCRERIAKVCDSYFGDHLLLKQVADLKPNFAKSLMQKFQNDETESSARRDADRKAIEAAKKRKYI